MIGQNNTSIGVTLRSDPFIKGRYARTKENAVTHALEEYVGVGSVTPSAEELAEAEALIQPVDGMDLFQLPAYEDFPTPVTHSAIAAMFSDDASSVALRDAVAEKLSNVFGKDLTYSFLLVEEGGEVFFKLDLPNKGTRDPSRPILVSFKEDHATFAYLQEGRNYARIVIELPEGKKDRATPRDYLEVLCDAIMTASWVIDIRGVPEGTLYQGA